MFSTNQRNKLTFTFLIALCINQSCGKDVLSTPSLQSPSATETTTLLAAKTSQPTIMSTVTPNYIATQNLIETESINAIVSTVQPVIFAEYPSLDKKWRVEIIGYPCINYSHGDYTGIIAYEQLKLINLSDGSEKIVDDQRVNCGGLGAFGFNGLYWSPNNRYFYYNDSREGSPDGGCGNYIPLPLYRLDTATQIITRLNNGFLSPDKMELAMWQGNEIMILELDKGEVARVVPMKSGLFNGRMWWSSEGSSILYLQTEFECAPNFW